MQSALHVHIGCGYTALDHFVNIDIIPGCDICLDLNTQALPFADNSVECVFSFHAMEHFENYLFVLGEIWRVLKHGGRFLLQVPYVTLTEYNLVNPFHKTHFNEYSFDFFDRDKLKGSANEGCPITFKKAWHRFHYLPEFASTPESELSFYRRHYFNVVRAIDFGLYAIKPPHNSIEIADMADTEVREEMDRYIGSRKTASWRR